MKQHIYTAWYDTSSTGDGRTLAAVIAYAVDEAGMREQVASRFDEFAAALATIEPGVVRNAVTQCLWPQSLFEFVESSIGDAGAVMVSCQLHANFG